MVTLDDIMKVVNGARENHQLATENYWLYLSLDGGIVQVSQEERKREGYIGYFIEDDNKLRRVFDVFLKRVRK